MSALLSAEERHRVGNVVKRMTEFAEPGSENSRNAMAIAKAIELVDALSMHDFAHQRLLLVEGFTVGSKFGRDQFLKVLETAARRSGPNCSGAQLLRHIEGALKEVSEIEFANAIEELIK